MIIENHQRCHTSDRSADARLPAASMVARQALLSSAAANSLCFVEVAAPRFVWLDRSATLRDLENSGTSDGVFIFEQIFQPFIRDGFIPDAIVLEAMRQARSLLLSAFKRGIDGGLPAFFMEAHNAEALAEISRRLRHLRPMD